MMLSRVVKSQLGVRNGGVLKRGFATSEMRRADFTHCIIGGGAVGLAVARQLAARPGTSTILVERNAAVGTETSSRNSEVIHAGLYYGPNTLKTELCIRGRQLLYALCKKHSIPFNNTGKWIVAQNNSQWEELVKLHKFTQTLEDVPTHFVALSEAAKSEPFVKADVGILESPTTGIVDSHSYMQFLLGDLEERGGDVALYCPVTQIEPLGTNGSAGWKITTRDHTTWGETSFTAETVINSAGLGAVDIHNIVVPSHRQLKAYFAKGNYFSYGASTPTTKRLIYPAPEPGIGGLGTHLTLDITGRIRFGPDVEWVDSPNNLKVSEDRLGEAIKEIKKYLPEVKEEFISPDYAGIRPKLGKKSAVVHGDGFEDFVIRREEGLDGWVSLLGIESPGLTSSLAIAERVEGLLYGSSGEVV